MILIVFDIETTGSNMHSNTCFAIGYCIGELNFGQPPRVIKQGKWVLDLGKPQNTTWEGFWKQRGWEQRCYTEFWSKNLPVLDLMTQETTNFANEHAMIKALNDFLHEQQTRGEFSVGFDTVAFDSAWINFLLQKYGHAEITKNRDGTGYRSVFELDSYRFGALGVDLGNWNLLYKAISDLDFAIKKSDTNAHDPQVDALNIFIDFANTYAYENSKVFA